MRWDGTTTVHNNWGHAPTLLKAIKTKLRVSLDADSIRLYKLNSIGAHSEAQVYLPVEQKVFEITVDQNTQQTPWFGIEAFRDGSYTVGMQSNEHRNNKLTIYPNPLNNELYIKWNINNATDMSISIFSITGKLLLTRKYSKATSFMLYH